MSLWGSKDSKSGNGTVTVTSNGLCVGVNSDFGTECVLGDYMVYNSTKGLIYSITNTTNMHIKSADLGGTIVAAAANTYTFQEAPIYVSQSEVGKNANDVFGVDATEAGVTGGPIVSLEIVTNGSGYTANAAVSFSGGGGASGAANAEANSIGRIETLNLTNAGTGYESLPDVTVADPSALSFNANSAVAANGFITLSSPTFQVGDLATYSVAASNTALAELTSGTQYYIQAANTTGVYLSATSGGAAITLTASDTSETGHTLQGETATARVSNLGGTRGKGVAHAGWNRRTVGTGGRAGRVQYETLVAGGSITGDAADDTILPDS